MARPCRAGHEAAGLEGCSPALRAWASNFFCVAKEKSPKERPPPPIRSLRGFPQGRCKVGRTTADGTLTFAIHGFGQSPLRTSCSRAKSGRAVLALFRSGPCAGCVCAIIPDGDPDLDPSPRRIGGGIKIVPFLSSIGVVMSSPRLINLLI